MTRSPSYLFRNQYGYYFRIHIPPDLQNYVGKKELKRSLRTGYLPHARSKAMVLGGRYQQLFIWVRYQTNMGKLTEQEIQESVDLFLEMASDADLWEGYEDQSKSLNPEELRDKILKAKDYAREYRHAIDSNDYSGVKKVENGVDFALGYTVDDPPPKGSPDYQLVCRKASEVMASKLDGYCKHHIERLAGAYNAVSDGRVDVTAEQADGGRLLSEVIQQYADEKKRGWSEKSKEEIVNGSLELFKEIVGDIQIKRIDRKTVASFKRTIVLLPSNMKKKPAYRDKTIDELVKMGLNKEIEEVLAPRTVNKHLGRVQTFFNWAKDNGEYEGDNPAPKGLNIPLDPDSDDKRAPYSIKDLTNIFNAEGYIEDNFSRSYMFWTPILALLHGMRQNEIAQLHLTDIKQVKDGTWVFDVNNLGDKRTKTDPSQRIVPIHPFLMNELGILKLKRKLLKEGHDRLFPEIKPARDGYGAPVSKWYNQRFKHKIELEQDPRDRWKDFHSFRTTFSTYLAHRDVPDKRIKQVIGHSTGSDVLNRHYIDKFDGKSLLDKVLKEANFHEKIDLSHLKKSKFVPK